MNQESEKTDIVTASTLAWTAHPVKRKLWVSFLVTLFIFVISYVVWISTGSTVFFVLSLLIMFGSLAKFFLPTKYELTDDEVIVHNISYTLKKSWSQYRSFYADKNGVLLSPFKERSRLENFRGLYLMFEKNNEQVTQFVMSHIHASTNEKEIKE